MRTDRDATAEFIATGSDTAFTGLVERHYAMVHGVCRRVAGNGADADDAAQAVFLVLAAQARRVAGREDVGGWLHHVARHVALRVRASAQARRSRERAAATAVAVEDPVDHGVDEALAALPERYRAPLVLHYYEGLSCAEVAERLRVRADNVAVRLSRGRQLLQRTLVRQGSAPAVAMAWLGAGPAAAVEIPAALAPAASAVAAGQQAAVATALPSAAALMKAACHGMAMAKAAAVALIATATLAVGGGVIAAASLLGAEAPAEPAPPVAAAPAAAHPDDILTKTFLDGLVERRRPRWHDDLDRRLDARVTFHADGMPLRQVAAEIARQCGQAISLAPELGKSAEAPVTLKVKDMRAGDALVWIAELTNTTCTRRDRELRLEPDGARSDPDEVIYHLERILRPPGTAPAPDEAEMLNEIVQLIRALSPDAVLEVDGGTLRTSAVGYPSRPPIDERALVLMRDRGRGSEATAEELRWRTDRTRRVDWRIDGDAVEAVQQLQRQGGVSIILDPGFITALAAARCRWTATATIEEAVQELARQLGGHVVVLKDRVYASDDDRVGVAVMAWHLAGAPRRGDEQLRLFDLRASGLEQITDPLLQRISALGLTQGWSWNGLLAVRWSHDRLAAVEGLLDELRLQPSMDERQAMIAAFGQGRPVEGYWSADGKADAPAAPQAPPARDPGF